MLLSEEEIEACVTWKGQSGNPFFNRIDFARAIEAAILAKLASAELPALPEPSEMDGTRWGYTSDDMQSHAIEAHAQGFAQGAAAQLSSEPSGFTTPDFCSIFLAESCAKEHGEPIPLYTRREA